MWLELNGKPDWKLNCLRLTLSPLRMDMTRQTWNSTNGAGLPYILPPTPGILWSIYSEHIRSTLWTDHVGTGSMHEPIHFPLSFAPKLRYLSAPVSVYLTYFPGLILNKPRGFGTCTVAPWDNVEVRCGVIVVRTLWFCYVLLVKGLVLGFQ